MSLKEILWTHRAVTPSWMLSTSQFPSTLDSHKFPMSQVVLRHPERPAPTAVFPRMHITTILRGSLYFLKHCSFSYTMLHRCDCTAPEKGNSCSSTFSSWAPAAPCQEWSSFCYRVTKQSQKITLQPNHSDCTGLAGGMYSKDNITP